MAYTSIQIDDYNAHYREQVTMIACSPNMKNVVTWSDKDISAVCWCVSDNQQELEPKHKIPLENNKKYNNYDKYFVYSIYIESEFSKNLGDIKEYFTVSDNMFVSMPISEENDMKVFIKDDDYVSKIEYIKRIKVDKFSFYVER
ncbi:hypothetical protein C2G38_2033068 [Gigaspora rosea]|uniref:Uncharacterized protein n=1 Tax=Gigaspora rosea TaxID=44941 RepID=A0A397VP51_9GLOM|nr:hypothetical protein C2G38_2033068 [Gigaspora rosea]